MVRVVIAALFHQRRDAAKSWPADMQPFHRVCLTFEGVRDLRLTGFGRTPRQVMGFDIRDVSDDGLEGVGFDVGDYEGDVIAFKCRDITVELVSAR